jgi:hypothetical protein
MATFRILLPVVVFGCGLALGKWSPWRPALEPAPGSADGVTTSAPIGAPPRGTASSGNAATGGTGSAPSATSNGPAANAESIDAFAAEPSALRRRVLARRYFDKLAADHFAALLTPVTKLEDTDILSMFFVSWTAKDPAAALDAIHALTSVVRGGILARCLGLWARKDFAAATKWLQRLEGREKRGMELMLQQIADSSGKVAKPVDPAAGLHPRDRFWSFVSVSTNGAGYADMQGKVLPALRDWVRQDPVEASQAILKSSTLRKDEALLRALYDEWKARDPAGADGFLSALPAESADRLVLSLALDASTKDVAAARLLAERLPTPNQRAVVLTKVGARLAAEDPKQASGWIESLQQTAPDFLPMSVFREWFKHDPAAAIQTLKEHPAYRKFRTENPQERVVANYFDFRPWVEKDPVAAGNFLASLPKADRATSLYNLGNNWVEKDAGGAIQWARTLPNSDAQDEALRQFTYSWAKHNVNGVTKHLDTLPTGSGKSAAIEGFAFATFDVDPDGVLQWVRAIPEESQRLDVLKRAWADWNRRNSRAAVDWMENVAELQPAERTAIQGREQ